MRITPRVCTSVLSLYQWPMTQQRNMHIHFIFALMHSHFCAQNITIKHTLQAVVPLTLLSLLISFHSYTTGFLFEQAVLEGPLGPATDDCRVMFSSSDELPMHFCITKSSSHSSLLTSLADYIYVIPDLEYSYFHTTHTDIISLFTIPFTTLLGRGMKQTAAIITAVTNCARARSHFGVFLRL